MMTKDGLTKGHRELLGALFGDWGLYLWGGGVVLGSIKPRTDRGQDSISEADAGAAPQLRGVHKGFRGNPPGFPGGALLTELPNVLH